MHRRKKVCVFCGKENNEIDYKDVAKNHRKLRKAPESTDCCHRESSSGCTDAVCGRVILIKKTECYEKKEPFRPGWFLFCDRIERMEKFTILPGQSIL